MSTGATIAGYTLAATLLSPAFVAAAAFSAGRHWPRVIGRVGVLAAGFGFLCATVIAVLVGMGETVSVSIGVLEWSADRLGVVLLLLVFGVSTVVQAFAVRYLESDTRAHWFTGGAGLLTTASGFLVTATTLVGIAAAWTVAGVALCLLLGTYRELPAARDGVRRTAIAFLIGDLALWSAVAVATIQWGAIDLMQTQPLTGAALPIVACLMVVAALSRSAQVPFHRWLPATLAAPTPVSALLHAGVVNAGGILLIKVSLLTAASDAASALMIIAGATTMVYAAVVTLVKPDIKGALAYSTMAQMGFMVMTCGLGLWAAAVFHLVAHGFYKATLFLSSGSAIAQRRRLVSLPPTQRVSGHRRALNAITALSLPAVTLLGAFAVVPNARADHSAEALLLFAWATGTAAIWGWLQRRPGTSGAITAAACLVPLSLGYAWLVTAVTGFLAPDVPGPVVPNPVIWLIAITAMVILGGFTVLRAAPGAGKLQRGLYARALSSSHVATSPCPTPAATPTSALAATPSSRPSRSNRLIGARS